MNFIKVLLIAILIVVFYIAYLLNTQTSYRIINPDQLTTSGGYVTLKKEVKIGGFVGRVR